MSRFTPGPWLVKEENGSYGVFSNDALLAITLSMTYKTRMPRKLMPT